MKKIIFFLLSFSLSFASSLQNLADTFSTTQRELLYKEFSPFAKLHKTSVYKLTQGWNKFTSPKDGINIIKTFHDTSKIKYVVTYYETGKLWAIYAPKETFSNMLFLKYLEPNSTFFVLAKQDSEIKIKHNTLNSTCQKFVDNKTEYSSVLDSGISRDYTVSKDGKMSLQSRYFSHHDRGIYNDTRTVLIYPKYKTTTKNSLKYGPANPKVAIIFPKVYEAKKFYIYDFKQEKCFGGIFPSIKNPPFPILKEMK
ncbi:hypothetical protein JHD49_04370 [Sulfurimonas sp. SAG-AH-194-C21]|nr:hypothetical protein [Sulfurimonas sp. SAG-AH-194-C21]MDF1883166.1 hypothetical protein [Sulfurimonas sp. SAG-AH-194-C21]